LTQITFGKVQQFTDINEYCVKL